MPALTLCIAAVNLGLGIGTAQATPVAPPRYHAATVLVADGGRVWATPSAVYRVDPPASFRLPRPEWGPWPSDLLVAPDGKTLCVRRPYDAYILNARTLRLVRRLNTPNVWWRRAGWLWMKDQADLNGVVVLAVDIERGYGFADRAIAAGTERNGFVDTHRLFLVRCSGPRNMKVLAPLVDVAYDPGSSGYPHRFRVGSPGALVFGYPYRGVDWLDRVGAHWSGHLRAPVKDHDGNPLVFWAPPIRAGSDVVGLAYAPRDTMAPPETSPRYLYRVSRAGVKLTPVTADVVLVTYDERRKRLGLGHKRQGYVEVVWDR